MSAVRVDGPDHTQARQRGWDVVTRALGEAAKRSRVTSFFDEPTNTVTHVVLDPASRRCAVIDSVLDYDAGNNGKTYLKIPLNEL